MSWYYSKNGEQLGPVSKEELQEKVKSGEIQGSDLVWKEGMGDWTAFSAVPEFQGASTPPATTTASAGSGATLAPTAPTGPAAVAQPSQAAAPYSGPKIPNFLVHAILVTIFCCPPFGIVAIVYATKVDSLVAKGDIDGAQAASKSAKLWVNIGAGCVLLYIIIAAIFGVMGGAEGSM